MANEFSDPELHRALGEMCLNFALLESMVSFTLAAICEINQPAVSFPLIWRQNMRSKIETLADIAVFQRERVPGFGAKYSKTEISKLCADLAGINNDRNAIVHGYWTVELGPLLPVTGDSCGLTTEMRAEVIRPVVQKFGRSPDCVRDHFPTEELPDLLKRIDDAVQRLSRLGNDFCLMNGALQPE